MTTRFAPDQGLIFVKATLAGPRTTADLTLVLDTAASRTILTPSALDDVGYGPRDGGHITSVTSVLGREYGYSIRVRRLSCLGFDFPDFHAAAFDLHDTDIDGLIGLDLLRELNLELRIKAGIIVAERV